MTHLELLREILGNLQRTALKPGPIGHNDLTQAGLAHGRLNFKTLEVTGLTAKGMRAVGELARSLQKNNPDLNRAASREKITEMLFSIVLDDFSDLNPTTVTPEHLTQLKARLHRWVATHRVKRLHLIGCLIAPRDCGAFAVGPVQFFHISKFDERRKIWAAQHSDAPDLAYASFLQEIAQSGAHYIAQVEVQDRESARSAEIADLTVDLALSGLQLIFPRKDSRHFARISGRRFSAGRDDLVISKDGVQTGGQNRSPGVTLAPDQFQFAMTHGSNLLTSIGNRLDGFLGHRPPTLQQLEKTWCDAAYWMHEGLAESIDTIAVAKLETALEVLLSAESAKLSSARMRTALRVFNGLLPDQRIFTDSPQTVNEFVKEVVETRSRVLHGTFSTLTKETSELARAIAILVGDHVLKFTLALDRYTAKCDAKDDAGSLLSWLEAERAWSWDWSGTPRP